LDKTIPKDFSSFLILGSIAILITVSGIIMDSKRTGNSIGDKEFDYNSL
jgi:hypothetical protein